MLLLSEPDFRRRTRRDRAPATAELRRSGARARRSDGEGPGEGGIARWLRSQRAWAGSDYVASTEGLLPARAFAVDPMCILCVTLSLEAWSSLTELFSPRSCRARLRMLSHYDFH